MSYTPHTSIHDNESSIQELVQSTLERNEFAITLLARQAAMQSIPGRSCGALFGLRTVTEAIESDSKEVLTNLARTVISESLGENTFFDDGGDTYMMDCPEGLFRNDEIDLMKSSLGPATQNAVIDSDVETEDTMSDTEEESWSDALED